MESSVSAAIFSILIPSAKMSIKYEDSWLGARHPGAYGAIDDVYQGEFDLLFENLAKLSSHKDEIAQITKQLEDGTGSKGTNSAGFWQQPSAPPLYSPSNSQTPVGELDDQPGSARRG